jgi:hypothetical protein
MSQGLSMLDGIILDMVAEGKSPRQIAEATGVSPAEAAKKAYDLLDSEIVTDVEQRRKLQVYRLEKMVSALWERTMKNGDKDDVKNIREILSDLNVLLGLNKEQDAEMVMKMQGHQFEAYMYALVGLITSFRALAPDLMTPDQWEAWSAAQLQSAKDRMNTRELGQ